MEDIGYYMFLTSRFLDYSEVLHLALVNHSLFTYLSPTVSLYSLHNIIIFMYFILFIFYLLFYWIFFFFFLVSFIILFFNLLIYPLISISIGPNGEATSIIPPNKSSTSPRKSSHPEFNTLSPQHYLNYSLPFLLPPLTSSSKETFPSTNNIYCGNTSADSSHKQQK